MKHARKWLFLVSMLTLALSLAAAAQAQDVIPINIGDTVTGTLSADAPGVAYGFSVTASTSITITLSSSDFDAYLVLFDTAGNIIAEDDDSAGRLNSRIQTTLSAGDYIIVATSLRAYQTNGEFFQAGEYTLSLSAEGAQTQTPTPGPTPTPLPVTPPPPTAPPPSPTPIPTQEVVSAIAVGQTVEGQLTNTQITQRYRLTAFGGDLITITLVSEQFDTYLFLLDENGVELARDDDSAGNLDSRIGPFEIPAAGTYTIVVDSYGHVVGGTAGTGSYTLTVTQVAVEPIEYTESVTGTIDGANPVAIYRFSGSQGDIVTLNLDTTSFAIYMRVTGDAGAVNTQTFGGSGILGPITLPASGRYVVTVATYDTFQAGTYTLTLNVVVPVAVQYGQVIQANFTDGPALYYTFEGARGEAVRIIVDSGGSVDTAVSVIGPGGFEIAADDDSGPGFDPEITSLVLQEDGTYSVVVRPYIPGDNGDFTLTITNDAIPSLDQGPQVVRLSSKQFTGMVLFDGLAGETVVLYVRVLTPVQSEPRITVTQGGTLLASNSVGLVSRLSMEFVVPADGRVDVIVQDFNGASVIIEFALERLTEGASE